MSRKVLIFLVEGYSDIQALEYPFGLYFDSVDPSLELLFLKPKNDQGDITGCSRIDQQSILKEVPTWWNIQHEISSRGFEPSDIAEIVQIIDIDGAYIDEEHIQFAPLLKKWEYQSNIIRCDDRKKAIERNTKKQHNITSLKSANKIRIGQSAINYSIYYFACNMDHYICGERNLQNGEAKCRAADNFALSFETGEDVYKFFNTTDSKKVNVCENYKESWNYLKRGNNSLSACSNIILLFNKYKNNTN